MSYIARRGKTVEQSLEPLDNVTWLELQNLFRQRYSKLGNTHEHSFHAWRSFNFDENTETIDSCVKQTRQVATLLGYGEPQVLKVFKKTLPTKLYWILFPIEDLRQALETAKRILNKEKLDKQLTDQTSTSPFMNIRDGTERKVSCNVREELGDKIGKLTVMMSILAVKDSYEKRPFKHQIYKSRGQNRSYNQRGYQNRNSRSDIGNSGYNNMEIIDLDKTIEAKILGGTLEDMEDKIIEENIEIMGAMSIARVGIGQEKGHSQGILVTIEIEVPVTVDQGLDLELVPIEIG